MPHSISAAKRVRQSATRHLRNKTAKDELKRLTKKLVALINAKKMDEAKTAFKDVASHFDKAAKKGVIHKNNANRHKSRLAQRLVTSIA